MDADRRRPALLMLTFATGTIDAATFLALGQVFAAMQTGNVIFLGLGIAGVDGTPFLAPLIALTVFLVGGTVATLALRRRQAGPVITAGAAAGEGDLAAGATLARWMALEAVLLLLAIALASAVDVVPGEAAAYCLIALLALTMGLRNTFVRGSAGANIATTVLNLTLIRATAGALPAPAASDDLRDRGAAVLAILAGAVAGALLVQTSLPLALALACAVTMAAAAMAASSGLRPVRG